MMRRLLVLGLLALAPASQAFVLMTDGTTEFRRWNLLTPTFGVSTNIINLNTHAIRYFLASDAYSTTNTTAELNALRASFGQWMAVSNTYLKFEEGGLVGPVSDVNNDDDTNVLFWAKTSTLINGGMDDITGALGVTYAEWQDPGLLLTDADIVFNGVNFAWFTDVNDPTTTKQLVDGVALHEIGHFIGLNHSPLGSATMFWRGGNGVNPQNGLHPDDLAGVRFLYPTNAVNYGAISGIVLKDGIPVLGAVLTAYDTGSNAIAGTLTHADGNFEMNKLPPGSYRLRVTPLDDPVASRLCAGADVDGFEYASADTTFLTGSDAFTTVTAGETNTFFFTVANDTPPLRIARIVRPTTTLMSFSFSGVPVQLRAGQSNYYLGVAWSTVPTNGTRLIVPGDGLTIGPPTHFSNASFNFVFATVKVSSNATPGARDLIVSNATTYAYAPGYFTILPTMLDDNFDGLDDSFQRTYFAPFTATNAAPTANPDGDAFNNLAEYISGTDPTNAVSFLKISSLSNSVSGTTVRWLGSVGKRYQVSARTNLTTASWQNLGSVVTTTNYFDNTPPGAARYYRVQALP